MRLLIGVFSLVWGLCIVLGSPLAQGEAPEPVTLQVSSTQPIRGKTHHVQGLAADAESYWISSVERRTQQGWLFAVNRQDGSMRAEQVLVDGERYHPGGMQLVGRTLVIPLAEYRPLSTTRVVLVNADTLQTERSFEVNDHLGATALDPDTGQIYGVNWDSKQFYVFDGQGEQLQRVNSPTGVAYQDLHFAAGLLYANGFLKPGQGGPQAVVDVIRPEDWSHQRRYHLEGTTTAAGPNFSREGFHLEGSQFLLMPEDGPQTRIYTFELP